MDFSQLGPAGIIIALLIAIGALGVKGVWVYGRYHETIVKILEDRLNEKQRLIDELLTVLGKSTETEEQLAAHILKKKGKSAERRTWEGRQVRKNAEDEEN